MSELVNQHFQTSTWFPCAGLRAERYWWFLNMSMKKCFLSSSGTLFPVIHGVKETDTRLQMESTLEYTRKQTKMSSEIHLIRYYSLGFTSVISTSYLYFYVEKSCKCLVNTARNPWCSHRSEHWSKPKSLKISKICSTLWRSKKNIAIYIWI